MMIVIPARGGSKGIPGKNIRMLEGKPLIQYTLEAARKLVPDNQIIVSTDNQEIKEVVEELGLPVPFLRPPQLATDTSGTYEVLLHALDFYEKNNPAPDKIVLLQPTSPFRNEEHIKEALNLYEDSLDMIVSVKETTSNPYYVLREENEEGFLVKSKKGTFKRRQDCPKVWEINGAIYVINPASLRKMPIDRFSRIRKFEMDEFSSHDLDTRLDWLLAEIMVKDFNIKQKAL
ncbi:MAG: acylneuraminate cytidylyltransferase family protein [Candidatus Bathyarchaeota archaeon]|nr:acylneuraminate cytidylyltransferase family protein [Candidatus Bathyarchaeota archaeon]